MIGTTGKGLGVAGLRLTLPRTVGSLRTIRPDNAESENAEGRGGAEESSAKSPPPQPPSPDPVGMPDFDDGDGDGDGDDCGSVGSSLSSLSLRSSFASGLGAGDHRSSPAKLAAELNGDGRGAAPSPVKPHRPDDEVDEDGGYDTEREAAEDAADKRSPIETRARRPRGRTRGYPTWVERLYALGADASSVAIEFRERPGQQQQQPPLVPPPLPPDGETRHRRRRPAALSREVPTRLCCVMRISRPVSLTVVGWTCPTKVEALESAALLAEEVAVRQLGWDAAGKRAITAEERRDDTAKDCDKEGEEEAKEGLLSSVPEMITYVRSVRPSSSTFVDFERSTVVSDVARGMMELGDGNSHFAVSSMSSKHCAPPRSSLLANLDGGRSLTSLLDEATALHLSPGATYQRLQFLGSSVLAHFVTVNLMAQNSNLRWDVDDLTEISAVSATVTSLCDAAHHIGLTRVVSLGKEMDGSAHRLHGGDDEGRFRRNTLSAILGPSWDHPSFQLGSATLGAMVESMLAVAFMKSLEMDTNHNKGSILIGLLNELELPLLHGRQKMESDGGPWFRALGPCIGDGYPFELHKRWKQQLIDVGTTMIVNHTIDEKLELGCQGLLDYLERNRSFTYYSASLKSQRSKILLRCALFDDNLGSGLDATVSISKHSNLDVTLNDSIITTNSGSATEVSTSLSPLDGLDRVAMLRDTLAFVGISALALCLSSDSYQRYPDATADDLHLLLTCATTDDVLSYVLVKNRIHEFLYDKSSESAAKFWIEMNLADKRGREAWEEMGGWAVPGGVEEFRQRLGSKQCFPSNLSKKQDDVTPCYAGLNGGVLRGKEGRLDPEITEGLAFSMKAIAGALCSGIGLEGMWALLGPLFEEILLLDPKELRKYCT